MALYWHMPMGRHLDLCEEQAVSRELSQKKEKKKILKRQPKHEPPRIKKQKIHQQYKSTRALDARYSNQQKLRRMYRNS